MCILIHRKYLATDVSSVCVVVFHRERGGGRGRERERERERERREKKERRSHEIFTPLYLY